MVNGADMPMQEFVNQVAEMTGKTIILDPRQQNAKVTVFSNTELDADGVYELFLTVLKVHGLGAVENNGVVEVLQNTTVKQSGTDSVDLTDAASSQLVTRVIPLSHVEASEIVKTIRPLMPQAAHVAAIENPNVLILADFASNISRLTSLIEQTDVLTKTRSYIANSNTPGWAPWPASWRRSRRTSSVAARRARRPCKSSPTSATIH